MRKPPTDLNIVRRFYDRWEPFEETRRQISDDLKELFAEAKAEGLNPKALRSAFKEQYRVENQTGDEAEKRLADGADFDLYLSALARVRESDDDFDPETGEIIEQELPADIVSQENTVGGPTAEGTDLASSADTESTAASQKRAQTATGVGTGGDNLGPASRSSAEAKTGVPAERETASDDQGQAPGDGQSQHNSGVRVAAVDTNSEPGKGELGETPSMAQRQATGEASAPASPVVPTAADNARKIRPWCLHADDLTKCGGYGRVHCHPCLKAHADEVGEAA